MKKTILALGLMVALASCGSGAAKEEAPVADSTAVAVDTTAKCATTDSCAAVCVDTATVVK
jgi:hypothetical protein